MPFYVAAWLTNIFYGFGSIASKLSSKHQLSNPWLFNFVLGVIITLGTIPIAIANGVQWPIHWGALWLAGLFSALAGTLFVLAMYKLDISILSPLYSLRVAFSILLGMIFFGELLTIFQLVLVSIIFIAGLFVSVDEHLSIRSFFRPVIGLAILAVLSSAIYSATLKSAMQVEGYWEVTLWNNVLAVIITFVTVPLFWKDLRKMHMKYYSGVAISGLAYTFGALTANIAYATNIGLSAAILAVPMSMIMAILFSLIKPELLEKHTLKIYAIRLSAAAVMVWAALRLSG